MIHGIARPIALALVAIGIAFATTRSPGNEQAAAGEVIARASPETVARGEYLARVANCGGCHTARDGVPFAGGRAIETPFGAVYAPNLTMDDETGIGRWNADDFWRAMHEGRSRDGRALLPAFPYENYTLVTREDADAIFAYLGSVPRVRRANRPHSLRPPFDTRWLQAAWRVAFFEPRTFRSDATRSGPWNRGAYLVRALGHCSACHGTRNAFGAVRPNAEFNGSVMPGSRWFAPSLHDRAAGGVQHWSTEDIVRLLRTGRTRDASVLGPMAEVVFNSTQHLSAADLEAMAVFLRSLPETPARTPVPPQREDAGGGERGRDLYRRHCADCHGEDGEGRSPAYPRLDGNRAVTLTPATNVLRAILDGGFAPATTGNPRPFGMPPFGAVLGDEEVAAVATYIRGAWNNRAAAVSPSDVNRAR